METIKVNMSPNPLDVQTIHASQNDTEARQWEFELHNNGELIDTSNVTEQLFFKAYKGGTEQILPENTSTPTTSPFKGDIKYPQGLLTDQEFLYRESPTEEDGLAKITDIKGNTLVWNQLIRNGNFADTSIWSVTGSGSSFTVSNNIATITASGAYDRIQQNVEFINGHKYLIKADIKKTNANDDIRFYYGNHVGGGNYVFANTTEWQTVCVIKTATENITTTYPNVEGTTSNLTWQQRDMMVIDLTQMGLDITSPSDFTSLFSLPYYAYNQGTLLSFNGNGIKTVGKNLFTGAESYSRETAGYYIREGETNNPLPLKLAKGTYTISIKSTVEGRSQLELFSGGIATSDRFLAPYISLVVGVNTYTFTIDKPCDYIRLYGNFVGTISDIQIEFGSTATDYEPYTSSTLSLPISTYFSNGMKSAGSVYDEWTPTKATTRIGAVDLGSLPHFYYTPPTSDKPIAQFSAILPNALSNVNTNVRCALYTASSSPVYGRDKDKTVCTFNGRVYICDSAYTDATAFKTAMSGVYLYYELVSPTETSFTTASLVTENAEIPLSNEDGVLVGKCTEQLSSESGFFDAKIKLADADGECYSNKIQLHVERRPS